MGSGGPEGGLGGEGGYGLRGPYGEGGEGNSDAMLLTNRYLDAEGQPVAATPESTPEELGVEFRRLPVRMELLMDERWIPTVLVECANAPLPIEVNCVRINGAKSGAGFEGAMGGGGYGRGGGEGGGYGRGGGGMMMGGGAEISNMPAGLSLVELQGVVYIYNPPKADVLALPGDDVAAEGAEEEGADVAGVEPADAGVVR
jgi:hypothetical protein